MILGVGAVVLDRSMTIRDIPKWDTVLHAHFYSTNQGGRVATALAASARLGVQSEFIGAIGDDEAGAKIVQNFIENKVSCPRLVVMPGKLSPCSICLVNSESGERTIIHYKGLQNQESLDVDLNLHGKKYLHLDGYWPKTAFETAQRARKEGVVVTLDPSSIVTESPYYSKILDTVDYMICGYAFASGTTQKETVEEMCHVMLRGNMKAIVVTRGEMGSYVYDGKNFTHVDAFKITALDTTGAGDVFLGAFIVGLSRNYTYEQCALFGNAAAALKCLKMGTQAGIPNQYEVVALLKEHGYDFAEVV